MANTHDTGRAFIEKHHNMFQGCMFKFNGLDKDTEEFFTNTVKGLGATISDDAPITFVDLPACDDSSDSLYSLVYIWDSIKAGKQLGLKNYKFCNVDCEKSDEELINNVISDEDDDRLIQNPLSRARSRQKQTRSKAKEKRICGEKESGRMKMIEELNCTMSYSPSGSEVEFVDDKENILKPSEEKSSKRSNKNKQEIAHHEAVIHNNLEASKENSGLSKKSCNDEKNKGINHREAESSDSHISDMSDEETVYQNNKQWWLPHDIPRERLCPNENCTLEPEAHENHSVFSHRMSEAEQKIVLKYLIRNNKISSAKGKKVYEDMIHSGYLSHRTAETLRNNMRRTILNNIWQFGFPPNILSQFKKLL